MKSLFIKSEVGHIVFDYIQSHGHLIVKKGLPQVNRMLAKDKQGNKFQVKLIIEQMKESEDV